MEDQNINDRREARRKQWEERCEQNAPRRRRKRALFGLTIVLFGTWWLLRRMDVEVVPSWALTWPVLLMAIGVINLIGHGFRNVGGYIMVIVGAVFFARYQYDIPINVEPYIWPAVVILIGLVILFKPNGHHHRHWKKKRWGTRQDEFQIENSHTDDSDSLDAVVLMGGVHKDIISKNFKGGEVTCIMGGAELYFSKADMESKATIDITCIMGGLKIVVPQNWNVMVNTTNILGGVDDKRRESFVASEDTKTLLITGTVVMGGIDIQSY
ncbi:MAG: LiaF-related protein [Flavobacteriales bacterium]